MTVLIYYSTKMKGAGKRILQVAKTVVSETNIHIYRTISALQSRLRQPRNGVNIAILLPSSAADITNLLSIRDLLRDIKIILILPNSNPETVAQGHLLRPKFLSYGDSDFIDVASVLSRMIRNLGEDKKIDFPIRRSKKNVHSLKKKLPPAKLDDKA
jgi:hypothetical protein